MKEDGITIHLVVAVADLTHRNLDGKQQLSGQLSWEAFEHRAGEDCVLIPSPLYYGVPPKRELDTRSLMLTPSNDLVLTYSDISF